MDLEKGAEEFQGRREGVFEVSTEFLQNVRSEVKTIHEAIVNGRGDTLRKKAHSVKRRALRLKAFRLAAFAKELEYIGTHGGSGRIAGKLLDLLQSEIERLEQCIPNKFAPESRYQHF